MSRVLRTRSTPKELCHGVQTIADRDLTFQLIPGAWDHYDPEESPWWLVRSMEWPAFAFGKYFFRWASDDHTEIFTGLQVERGVDPSLAGAFEPASMITQPDWEWFRFVRSVNKGMFENVLGHAAGDIATPVYVRLAVGIYNPGDAIDRKSPRIPNGQVTFVWDPPKRVLQWVDTQGDQTLVPLARSAKTLSTLLEAVASASGQERFWVNILTGIRLELGSNPTLISENELWRKFLSRFKTWVSP